ncbi:hypothetical protein QA612_10875 [Evansella sp. AB-P1]|uniref:hypothetical protein n=1 Tax=Evansella sp. AB-P1 TaxID=3037653 RepID=UPI00241FCA5A|nr:hypothetical protein [Evansella sp. AB-P1]MDG5787992.1 hypothetical protein [Evansella sp. AB-P1]
MKEAKLITKVKSIVNNQYEGLLLFLKELPHYTDRKFETNIATLAAASDQRLLQKLDEIKENDDIDDDLHFTLFVVKATFFRRHKDHTMFLQYVDKYKDIYYDNPLFLHILSMAHKTVSWDKDTLLDAIEYSRKAVNFKEVENHVGILHNFSENVVIALEEEFPFDTIFTKSLVEQGYKIMKKIVQLDPDYPKFQCTMGRWMAIYKKEYNLAKRYIESAIDKESSQSIDYSLRIGDYQRFLLKTEVLQNKDQLNEEVSKTKKELEAATKELNRMKDDNLKTLGFFTAILGVIIGSLQIISGQEFYDAALLIVILCGALILSFASFTFIIFQDKRRKLTILLLVISGAILISGSVLTYILLN